MTDRKKCKTDHRCVICWNKLPEGYTKVACQACTKKTEERSKEQRRKFIAEKRCAYCGAQDERTLSGRTRCLECATRAAKCTASRYYWRVSNHVCAKCGKPLEKDYFYTKCKECKEKASMEYHERWKRKHDGSDQSGGRLEHE